MLLLLNSNVCRADLIAEAFQRYLHLRLVGLDHLRAELVNDLALECWHEVVLHLNKHIRHSLND